MKKTVICLTMWVVVGAAYAQAAKIPATLPGPIAAAVTGGLKVENTFKAPGGMDGWILSQGVGQNMVVYTSADGSVAIAGNMLDVKGANLTKEHLVKFGPKTDYAQLWGELEKSTFISEGAAGKDRKSTVYVFEDANCSFCHLAWKALKPYLKVGLEVRWVPVAFLSKTSFDKAAATLSAKDPSAAFSLRQESYGSSETAPDASPAMRTKIDANNKLMQGWGFRGTPAIIYKDANGTVLAAAGMPSLSRLPAITGLPAQPNTDPALERFR
jgi:thiol:disulfide interchange protein DsbG